MVENEFKIMLTEAQYNTIHGLYSWDKEVRQVNSYYDSGDLQLSERHITCRVRAVEGKYLLQMKLPAGELNNGAVSRVELEKPIDNLPPELPGGLLAEMSGAENLPDVKLLGDLSTFRSIKKLPGAEIDLDKSEYFGRVDYELEIEYSDEAAAEALLSEISAIVEISTAAPVTGKIRRFLEEYTAKREL